jgi:hypothetical protein
MQPWFLQFNPYNWSKPLLVAGYDKQGFLTIYSNSDPLRILSHNFLKQQIYAGFPREDPG